MSLRRSNPWPYLVPAIIVVLFVFLYPMLELVRMSTTTSRHGGASVGLRNFRLLLRDPSFVTALQHNAILFATVPILVALALLFAILLFERVRGWQVYRFLIFLPFVLAIPVVGIVWSYMLQLHGVVNTVLNAIHLHPLALDWLGNPRLALLSVMGVIIWKSTGFGVVLFLARLMTIQEELIDAAKVDGAGWWNVQRHITVPQLSGVINFYVIISVINMLSWVFNYIFVMTRGGPGRSTIVSEFYIYQMAFQYNQPNIAAAAAVLIFSGALVVIVARFLISKESLGYD